MKKTILFDLDGTLIDSTEAILSSFFDVYDKYDFKKPKESEIKSLIGYTLEDMFDNLGMDKKNIPYCVASYKEFYRSRSCQMTKLLPLAEEAVKYASGFAKLGIVTTKTGKYSKELLEHFDMMKYFAVLIGREDVTNPKPHSEPILKALKILDKDKQNCWMIGDTKFDILSAQNASVNSVALLSGYGSREELEKYDTVIKDNSYEAVKYIKNC